jgi:hypothetical protein
MPYKSFHISNKKKNQKRILQPLRKKEVKIEFPCKSWFNCPIPDEVVSASLSLWNSDGGDRKSAKSFWISAKSCPNNSLEEFALNCGKFHLKENFVGAEYWVQLRTVNDVNNNNEDEAGLQFHFDKDEQALIDYDVWSHPTLSTVTYLDVSKHSRLPIGGPPIVIFETEENKENGEDDNDDVKSAFVSFPESSRHIAFNGKFLHGVSAELNQLCSPRTVVSYSRLSLLVNIWSDHRPIGCKRRKGVAEKYSINNINFNIMKEELIKDISVDLSNKKDENNLYILKELRDEDELDLGNIVNKQGTAPLPLKEIRNESNKFNKKNNVNNIISNVLKVNYL